MGYTPFWTQINANFIAVQGSVQEGLCKKSIAWVGPGEGAGATFQALSRPTSIQSTR
jgi:hypothetical protein